MSSDIFLGFSVLTKQHPTVKIYDGGKHRKEPYGLRPDSLMLPWLVWEPVPLTLVFRPSRQFQINQRWFQVQLQLLLQLPHLNPSPIWTSVVCKCPRPKNLSIQKNSRNHISIVSLKHLQHGFIGSTKSSHTWRLSQYLKAALCTHPREQVLHYDFHRFSSTLWPSEYVFSWERSFGQSPETFYCALHHARTDTISQSLVQPATKSEIADRNWHTIQHIWYVNGERTWYHSRCGIR